MKGPFIHSKNSTNKIMRNLIISLIPIILFTFYKNGIFLYLNNKTSFIGMFYPLIFIFISAFSSFIFEYLYNFIFLKKRGLELKEIMKTSFSIFPGLFVSLVLPLNTPIPVLIFGTFMATIIGKMIYGGFGHNIFNPALIGCLFVIATYTNIIVNNGGYFNTYELDTISSATPLSIITDNNINYDTLVKPFGNLLNFFFGFIPGSTGETCSFLIIISFLYLTFTKTIKWKIPVTYVGTVFIITMIIALTNGIGMWYPVFQILSGGLLFGATFMATDPVTSPTTSLGQIIYGIMLGVLTVICRYLTTYPEGVLTSILIMNMFVFILDKIGMRSSNYKFKIIISIISLLILIFSLTFYISSGLTNKNIDDNFNIISKDNYDNKVVYVATEKGFEGNIKASVTIENGKVTDYEILECNDDYLSTVLKENYLEDLKNSTDLEEIDTVSGATRTSTALKKLLINVIKDSEA